MTVPVNLCIIWLSRVNHEALTSFTHFPYVCLSDQWPPHRNFSLIFFCKKWSEFFRVNVFHYLKDNMEYLQHDYILKWTAYEPLILWLSCKKWSCGTYQDCWKEWYALHSTIRYYRESTYLQTQNGICGTVLTVQYMPEWQTQKLWSCFNFKFYKY